PAGDVLLFTGADGVSGRELWKTDGTPEGTVMVKDIYPGSGFQGSLPLFFTQLGSVTVFRAGDTNGIEIWRTDGTAEGTWLLKDIEPGAGSSYPASFTVLGTNLLFAAREGEELWKTAGTSNGTVRLRTFGSATPSSSIDYMIAVGTNVFFRAVVGGDAELWRSDGTSNGTVQVANLNPSGSSYPVTFADLNGIAILAASDGTAFQLWRSDGTSDGTWRITGTNGLRIDSPNGRAVGNLVYFSTISGTNGVELWRTDGTSNGTFMIKDISPGPSSSYPNVVALMDGFTLLAATTPEHGTELWRTDGTEAGTVMVKDINTRTGNSTLMGLGAVGDTIYFSAGVTDLWKTDGTTTERLHVFDVPGYTQNISAGVNYSNRLIFSARNTNGYELWISDGTSNGTRQLRDILPGFDSSFPNEYTPVGSNLFFSATGTNGLELWKTDGTETGTVEVRDLRPGSASSSPSYLTEYQGALFFHAFHASGRSGLWRSDGTATGTVRMIEFTNLSFYGMAKAAGQLFLFTSAGTDATLWHSRGTPETTAAVRIVPIANALGRKRFSYAGNAQALLFTAGETNTEIELWRSDGTMAGTHLVKDINPGPFSSLLSTFVQVEGITYFKADDGVSGEEIWRSDGTPGGTRLLRDIAPGVASSTSSRFSGRMVSLNGLLFFWANDVHGTELWMTDGTEEGTALVKDIDPSAPIDYSTYFPMFDAAGNRLFFLQDDGLSGRELWAVHVPARPTLVLRRDPNLVIETHGEPNQPRILEYSFDLQTWTATRTNTSSPDGSSFFANPTGGGRVFFRIRAMVNPP
ncbi:MAG TPA: ELWxxDGT repeat protein, partial [Verrucomicrobiae bacterium]